MAFRNRKEIWKVLRNIPPPPRSDAMNDCRQRPKNGTGGRLGNSGGWWHGDKGGNANVNKINYFVIIYGNDGNALMIFASLGHKEHGSGARRLPS